MFFKQIDEIVNGTKTQTRHVCKDGEFASMHDGVVETVFTKSVRPKWTVGNTYAVQPGRGKPGVFVNFNHPCYGYDIWDGTDPVQTDKGLIDWRDFAPRQGYQPLRIRLLSIRREPLQAISEADAVAEGCSPCFCQHCISNEALHGIVLGDDCPACNGSQIAVSARDEYRDLWETINGTKSWERDQDKDVWRLSFAVVQ